MHFVKAVVPPETKARLKEIAKGKCEAESTLVRQAVQNFLKQHEKYVPIKS